MIRADALTTLKRWREVAGASGVGALGAWLIWLGGWLLTPVGVAFVALAAGWGVIALRRIRFARAVSAPGVVEVDEGQVGYLGPTFGGFVSLRELVDLRLVSLQGAAQWRLKQADGQVLMIPVAAQGSDKLFDAFATLDGIDMGALTAALDAHRDPATGAHSLWSRSDCAALT